MFELTLSNPLVMLVASTLAGLSMASLTYAVAGELQSRGLADELARTREEQSRRPRARRTGILWLAGLFLPIATALGRTLGMTGTRSLLAQAYARAGYPGGYDDDELLGLGLMLGIPPCLPPALVIALALDPIFAPIALIALPLGPLLLRGIYHSRGSEREMSIERVMPFVLDLLVLTMRAGASLQQAIERVAEDYVDQPIGVEFSAVLSDLSTGTTVREAFENMSERLPIPQIRSFVDDLIQGDELGRPLAEVFERQSDQARVQRVQDATDTAGKAKVKVLVPNMLQLIAALIVIGSPFFLRWYYGGSAF